MAEALLRAYEAEAANKITRHTTPTHTIEHGQGQAQPSLADIREGVRGVRVRVAEAVEMAGGAMAAAEEAATEAVMVEAQIMVVSGEAASLQAALLQLEREHKAKKGPVQTEGGKSRRRRRRRKGRKTHKHKSVKKSRKHRRHKSNR